jgi:hypothetical protein
VSAGATTWPSFSTATRRRWSRCSPASRRAAASCPSFRLHPNEYGFILDHSESKAVILSGEFNDGVLAIRDRIPGAQHLIMLEGGSGPLLDYEALLAAEPPAW